MLSVVDIVIYLLYRVLGILVACANWLLLLLIALYAILLRALRLLLRAAWSAARVILIPAVSLLVAATLMVLFAHADIHYVKTGSLAQMYPFRPVRYQAVCGGVQGLPARASRSASSGCTPWLRAVAR